MRVICEFCNNSFDRPIRRYNEAIKRHWRQFCSPLCLKKSKIAKLLITCSNPKCQKSFTRTQSEISNSKLLFCSISCSTSYYNAIRQNFVLLRKCKRPECGNYIHSTDKKINYCGGKCSRLFRQGVSSYTPESVITIIQNFTRINCRIPTRNELGHINRLTRKFFGSWNKAIEASGYNPNPVMFAKHYTAKDGHKCDSMAEMIVDNWLYHNGINHQVHVQYPWNNGMKCDFLVEDTWVEIFGLKGSLKRYDELKKKKLTLIKQYKLKLLSLSLKDVYTEEKLNSKLNMLKVLN